MGIFGFSTVVLAAIATYLWTENKLEALSIPDSHHYVEFIARGTPTILRIVGKAENNCTGIVNNNKGKIQCRLKDFKTGIALRDRHMLEYIHANAHPMVSLTFEAKGDSFDGIVELNGRQKAVSGSYASDPLKFEFEIDIKDFGIKSPNYLGVGIKDVVTVSAGLR